MERHRLLGVGLCLLGSLLVANPLYVYQHPDEVNEVRVLEEYDGVPAANYSYEDLSPRARELFRGALDSGSVTFHGNHRRPDDFVFAEEDLPVRVEGEVYRIEYEGETHYLLTFERPPLRNEAERSTGLIVLGTLIGGVGLLYVWRRQPSDLGLAVGGVGTTVLALNVGHRYAHGSLGVLTLLGSSGVILFATLVTVVVGGYLVYRTMRERRFGAEGRG